MFGDTLRTEAKVEGITLLAESRAIISQPVEDKYPDHNIYVCDAYVQGIESKGEPITGGFKLDQRLFNIDHHAPIATMQRRISSAPLAIEYIRQYGSITANDAVLINHVDADSVLSSSIIPGVVASGRAIQEGCNCCRSYRRGKYSGGPAPVMWPTARSGIFSAQPATTA